MDKNIIEGLELLKQNKQDLVDAINSIISPEDAVVTMETPLSKLAELLKWCGGYGGCPIAVIDKTTKEQRFFSAEQWEGMGVSGQIKYTPIGVCLLAEGKALIIAKSDAMNGTSATMTWSADTVDVSGLKNYSDTLETENFYDDFNGKGKTDVMLAREVVASKTYPSAHCARAYKAYTGETEEDTDPTEYFLGDVSEWTLIDRYRTEVNAALYTFFASRLASAEYWTSDEHSADYAWRVGSSGSLNYNTNKVYNNYLRVRPFAAARVSAIVNT